MTTPNTETYSQKLQISDANPEGQVLGQSATDKIGLYGAVPLAQRSFALQSYAGIVTSTSSFTAASDIAPVFGNWTTLSSASGVSSTFVGYTATGAATATSTAYNSSANSLLIEIAKTLVAMGAWKGA